MMRLSILLAVVALMLALALALTAAPAGAQGNHESRFEHRGACSCARTARGGPSARCAATSGGVVELGFGSVEADAVRLVIGAARVSYSRVIELEALPPPVTG